MAEREGAPQGVERPKTAREDLAHMHELMQYVIAHAQSAIAVHDRDMKYVYVSEQYLEQYKVKEKDVIGKHHYDVFPDLPQKWRDVHRRVLAGAVEGCDADPYVRDDGTVDWTRWECRPWYEHDGSVGGLIVYTEVITERMRREENLRVSEERLRKSQEVAKIGSWSWDVLGDRLDWSEETFRRFDKDPALFQPTVTYFFKERVHPDDRAALQEALRQSLDHDAPLHIQPRIRNDSGREWVLEGFGVVERDERGSPLRVSGTAQDVTERKAAQAELIRSQALYHDLVETAQDLIWQCDAEGRYLYLNPAWESVLGYRTDEMLGRRFSDFQAPEQARRDLELFGRLLETGTVRGHETVHRAKDGRDVHLVFNAKHVRDATGRVVGSRGTAYDVTERRRAEEKVRQSEQLIRSILDTVDEGFLLIDRDHRILAANRAYCSQAGRPSEDVVGNRCHDVSHRLDRPCLEQGEDCPILQVFGTGRPHTVTHRHLDRGGRALWVEVKGFPIKDSSGSVASVIETVTDLTERRLLEEERLKTQKLESIGTLAGGIAHDFNNLLQGVFGYISMAKLTLDRPDKALAMLAQAEKALHQSVNLTTQLLTFSKGGKPVKKRMSLLPVVETAAGFALSGSRCRHRVEGEPGLWEVEADEGQLGQVLQNIALNADQAMPLGGSVDIRVRNMPAAETPRPPSLGPRDHVLISIRDSGVGIPAAYLPKIFDPYFTTKEKGSGLGLATSYSIIRNHGGLLEAESEVGKGSTFRIYLPAAAPAAPEPKPEARPLRSRAGRVLVMDDEELIRNVAAELLSALGYTPSLADRGESAIEAYRRALEAGAPFDAVILDLTIRGGMGGDETIQRLVRIDPGVKAVVSSGYSDQSSLSDYRQRGFKAFLKKPYNLGELASTLDALLSA